MKALTMRRAVPGIAVLVAMCVSAQVLYAHICHSIFMTPGLLAVRPEKDVATLRKSDQFKVYVQNNYVAPLTRVRLTARAEDPNVTVKLTPEAIDRLRPGERGHFTVDVEVKDTRPRDFALKFSITAQQLKLRVVQEPTEQELRAAWKQAYLCGQVYAAEALARRGDADAVDFLKRVIRQDTTIAPRRSYPAENVGRTARLVGRMGHKALAPYLRERYRADESSWARGNLLLGLAALGLDEDREAFAQAAGEKDGFVRACGLLALTMRGDKEAPEKLKTGMSDADVRTRLVCAWGRAIARDPEAVKLLESVADAKDMKSYSPPPLPGDEGWHKSSGGGGWGGYSTRTLAGDAMLDLAARNP
jgi:hypothetical protein